MNSHGIKHRSTAFRLNALIRYRIRRPQAAKEARKSKAAAQNGPAAGRGETTTQQPRTAKAKKPKPHARAKQRGARAPSGHENESTTKSKAKQSRTAVSRNHAKGIRVLQAPVPPRFVTHGLWRNTYGWRLTNGRFEKKTV